MSPVRRRKCDRLCLLLFIFVLFLRDGNQFASELNALYDVQQLRDDERRDGGHSHGYVLCDLDHIVFYGMPFLFPRDWGYGR